MTITQELVDRIVERAKASDYGLREVGGVDAIAAQRCEALCRVLEL